MDGHTFFGGLSLVFMVFILLSTISGIAKSDSDNNAAVVLIVLILIGVPTGFILTQFLR
jgi:hypothetical protein